MTSRTIIAVVSDLVKSVLTVEQQILVNELALMVADLQRVADQRSEWRDRQRLSRDKRKEPKENNILNKSQGGSRGELSRDKPAAEPLFDEFWAVYPLKVGKGAALKAYRHALTRASHAEILAGAKRYAASRPEPKFTAHASTWLNADRWADETRIVEFRTSPPRRTWAEIQAEKRETNADGLEPGNH